MNAKKYYAVVRSHGCYGNGETVYAARVCETIEAAEKYAATRARTVATW